MLDPLTASASPVSSSRRPRGVVRVNGTTAPFLAFEVVNKDHFTADTWSVTMEPWQAPAPFTQPVGLQFWDSAATNTTVEILIGMLDASADVSGQPPDPTSLVLGQVDDVVVEPLTGKLTLSGRDLSARLIDTKISTKFSTRVSSDIVTELAENAGLTPNVTPTTVPAGKYFDSHYAALARTVPAWDVIVFLAQNEGFSAYVSGQTLYFGPSPAQSVGLTINVARASTGQITSNAKRLSLRRSLTLGQDISVTVISYHPWDAKAVKATATRAGRYPGASSAARSAETTQSYIIRRPGLTQQQAQQVANSWLQEITRFERLIDLDIEGSPTFGVTQQIQLAGTGTTWDGIYYPQRITRSFSFRGGFSMSVRAKNHPPLNEPNV
jgi:phage protein D